MKKKVFLFLTLLIAGVFIVSPVLASPNLPEIIKKLTKIIIVRRESQTIELNNSEMIPNTFTDEVDVDGFDRITIYTECVRDENQVPDLPLYVWSSPRSENPRFYTLTDGELKCQTPKTIPVQGAIYKIQYLGDSPATVAIRVYLVP